MVERWEIAEPLRAKMIEVARQFRKQPTPSEAILWRALRGQQFDGRKFRRQQPIGPFVVDFFCPSERLIVEVDGPIHNEQRAADRQRQELIEALGLRFVRVTAADVETNLDAVLATIRSAMRPPLPGAGADKERSHPLLPGAGAGAGADNEHSHPPLPGAGAGAGADNKHSHPPLPSVGAGAGADNKHSHPPLPSVGEGGRGGEGNLVRVTAFPRAALKLVQLGSYVEKYSHLVPQARLGRAAWSLEVSDVDDLMEKIKRAGVPLAEFAGVKPYYGIKTGLNEAFLIDTPTKDRLVREDPRSAEIIKPYLRGQDIKRWAPEWEGLWLIALKSSSDYAWPWATAGDQAEALFQQHYVAIHRFFKPLEAKLRMRQDKGRYWWELRACAYYGVFEKPKIVHTDITWRPQFAYITEQMYLLNTAYVWPITDLFILVALNSPLLWSYMWRNAMHGKDEALRLIYSFVETIPIAPPTDAQRAEVEPAVERLIAITQANQAARRDTLDWLRTEFGVEAAGQKLEAFATLDEAAFVEEVRKRRPKSAGKLSPAGLRALREGYAEQAAPVQQRQAEALKLERRLAELVNQAYGLTPEEIDLLWRTAPPRMPVGRS
jgi:very-short-patch-repair endonuclease